MADETVLHLRISKATGLSCSSWQRLHVSIFADGKRCVKSSAIRYDATESLAHWEVAVDVPCCNSSQLLLQVTKQSLLGCSSPAGGCSLNAGELSFAKELQLPLWDRHQHVIGQLVVDMEWNATRMKGSLRNHATLTFGNAASLQSSARVSQASTSPSNAGLVNHAAMRQGTAGLKQASTLVSLPGSLPNSEDVSPDAVSSRSIRRAGTTGSAGLVNMAADGSGQASALSRACELLKGLADCTPQSDEERRKLGQALELLRATPEKEIKSKQGKGALQECGRLVEKIFHHALAQGDDKDANGALWLAGRLPSSGKEEDSTLQDKLRQQWEKSRMESAFSRAAEILQKATTNRSALEELMEALDMAEFHAQVAGVQVRARIQRILAQLRPDLSKLLQGLMQRDEFDQVGELLNVIGAARMESLGLVELQYKLETAQGFNLLRHALLPTESQVGFPVLKERQLRHAVMTLRTGMADDRSQETRAALKSLLLEELLRPCMKHSDECARALLDSCFRLGLPPESIWEAVHHAFLKLSPERKRHFSEFAERICSQWDVAPPDWLLTPEQMSCLKVIRKALGGHDLASLQSALVHVKQTSGGREACEREFTQALSRLKDAHRLPEGWDVESMLIAGRRDARLLAKQELDHRVVAAFNELIQRSTNPVWTRDRRGQVPHSFQAVRAIQVMNASTWATYVQRRDEIAAECRRLRCRSDEAYWQNNLNGVLLTMEPAAKIATMTSAPPLLPEANEVWLFHGTSHAGAETISADDFDIARASPTGLFGAGLYFAESVSKADEYVKGKKTGGQELFALLLCRVCLGNTFYCDERLPDRRDLEDRCLRQQWHSVVGDRKKTSGTFRELVVYDNLQVFPGYIVYYTRAY